MVLTIEVVVAVALMVVLLLVHVAVMGVQV
jgi:hypothetical protein